MYGWKEPEPPISPIAGFKSSLASGDHTVANELVHIKNSEKNQSKILIEGESINDKNHLFFTSNIFKACLSADPQKESFVMFFWMFWFEMVG